MAIVNQYLAPSAYMTLAEKAGEALAADKAFWEKKHADQAIQQQVMDQNFSLAMESKRHDDQLGLMAVQADQERESQAFQMKFQSDMAKEDFTRRQLADKEIRVSERELGMKDRKTQLDQDLMHAADMREAEYTFVKDERAQIAMSSNVTRTQIRSDTRVAIADLKKRTDLPPAQREELATQLVEKMQADIATADEDEEEAISILGVKQSRRSYTSGGGYGGGGYQTGGGARPPTLQQLSTTMANLNKMYTRGPKGELLVNQGGKLPPRPATPTDEAQYQAMAEPLMQALEGKTGGTGQIKRGTGANAGQWAWEYPDGRIEPLPADIAATITDVTAETPVYSVEAGAPGNQFQQTPRGMVRPETKYRTNAKKQPEVSYDGGQTWHAWVSVREMARSAKK